MKTPQRNFTVEIKSSRRRLKVQPKSIWGNVDFKSLAREAEAAHLFNTAGTVASEVGSEPAEQSFSPVTVLDSAEEQSEELQMPSPAPELEAVAPPEAATPVSTLASADEVEQAVTPQEPLPSPRRNTGDRLKARRAMTMPTTEAKSERSSLSSFQSIADLEDENHRLKILWKQKLELENAQLRKMLERFESN